MPKKQHEQSRLNPSGGTLGEDVRRVREARKLSQRALAHVAGYSVSYVSKVEAGVVIPALRFAEGCDRAFGTGDLFTRQLHRVINGEHPSWFAPFIEAEQEASTIEDYSTLFVFGLLQKPEYARASLEGAMPGADPRDLDAGVAGRVRRREVLERDDPPQVWVVLHEACLRTTVGTPEVMSAQLAYLCDAARRYPTLTLQVLPMSASARARATPFTLLGFAKGRSSVHVEGPQGGRPYEDVRAVTTSRGVFEHLRACSLSPHDSLDLIKTAKDEHDRQSRMDQVQLQRRWRGQLPRVGPGSPVRRRGSRPGQ